MTMPARLPFGTLLRCCGRSFLLQASWNYDRLQNLGFLYQLLPGLRRLYGRRVPAVLLERYAVYFNTHPYLAPWVAGTVLSLESELPESAGAGIDGPGFQQMVMAPYAAMGDALFWGAIRPLAAVIGLLLAIQGFLWAPLVLLLVYNLPHLLCRCGGLVVGVRQGLAAVETLQRLRLPDVAIRIKEGTIILLGVLCALLAERGCGHQELAAGWGLLLLPIILIFASLARRGVTSFVLILTTTVSLLGLAVLFRG